jgi:hypothetical protein
MSKARWIGATALGVFAAATYLGTTWGSTSGERRRLLPSDDLVPEPSFTTNHAITIRACSEDVWPWLVQTGWHRGGWYTYRWVDRLLFPANAPSANDILPQFQGLQVGDHVPDGAPETGCYFVVERMDPPHMLVLRSRTHLPPRPKDAWLDWVWTWSVEDVGDGAVRVLLRTRGAIGPRWLALAYRGALWTDFVMARSHLRGLRARVERRSGDGQRAGVGAEVRSARLGRDLRGETTRPTPEVPA